jgi:hypothetical protein
MAGKRKEEFPEVIDADASMLGRRVMTQGFVEGELPRHKYDRDDFLMESLVTYPISGVYVMR